MLNDIASAIFAVCPIEGVSRTLDGIYSVQYQKSATDDQRKAAQAIIANAALIEAQADKRRELQASYEAAIATGHTDATGLWIDLAPQGRADWNFFLIHWDRKAAKDTDSIPVLPDGTGKPTKYGDLKGAVTRGMEVFYALQAKLTSLRGRVDAAGTIAAVKEVAW